MMAYIPFRDSLYCRSYQNDICSGDKNLLSYKQKEVEKYPTSFCYDWRMKKSIKKNQRRSISRSIFIYYMQLCLHFIIIMNHFLNE
jgi:hypothetical protein